MEIYLDLLRRVMADGIDRGDRTGTGTRSVFGHQMRFDLTEGFPLLTTKRVHTRSVFGELLWFLRGDTNIAWLHENRITIWDEWADENGNLGPIYGYQWRSWPTPDGRHVDQLAGVIESLRSNRSPGGTSSPPGTSPMWTPWPCPHATPCSSSTWPTAG